MVTHLIQNECLVVIQNTNLASIGKLQHVNILNVDDVLNRQRDLDAVAVIMRPEDDPLYGLDPFLSAGCTVRAEMVGTVVGGHDEIEPLLLLIRDVDGYGVPEVDLAVGEVDVGGVRVVREDVALETEPISVVMGIPPAAL